MMNYELFKEITAERFLDYMPDDYKNCRVEINPFPKVNKTLDGLQLIPDGNEKWNISPTIYVNDMYDKYRKTEDLEQVLESAALDMAKAFHQVSGKAVDFLNLDHAKDNIIMTLINTEQNKEMLMNIPHREFQDLSIIYRLIIEKGTDNISSTMVNHSIAKKLGMEEADLYNAAFSNTKRLLPPTVKSMNQVITEMFIKDGMPAEVADMMIGETELKQTMYVISNDKGIGGAVSMLYETELHKLAESMESDLYIMPSSIHEVIAISTEIGTTDHLAEMVADINMNQVTLEERLSNQVYHYDKDLREITLATATPNKRLDGIVAEPGLTYESKLSR